MDPPASTTKTIPKGSDDNKDEAPSAAATTNVNNDKTQQSPSSEGGLKSKKITMALIVVVIIIAVVLGVTLSPKRNKESSSAEIPPSVFHVSDDSSAIVRGTVEDYGVAIINDNEPLLDIAVGYGEPLVCAIRANDNSVFCWGNLITAPHDLKAKKVAAGFEFACAIRLEDDNVECWGEANNPIIPPADLGPVSDVSIGMRLRVR